MQSLKTIIIYLLIIINLTNCGMINMQEGTIDILDSNDEVIKLYKKIEFSTDFSEDENTLDQDMNNRNALNNIKCIASINSIGTSNTIPTGINLSISTTFITNHSFYLVYNTINSPTLINKISVNWTCFTSKTISTIDFKYKKGDNKVQRYSIQTLQSEKWQENEISSGDSLKEYQGLFIINSFESNNSEDMQLGLDLLSGQNQYFYTSVNSNASINAFSGVIIIAPNDSCTLVNAKISNSYGVITNNHNNKNIITKNYKLNGEFDSYKAKDYGLLYGFKKISLNLISNDHWLYSINNYDVDYKNNNLSAEIALSQNNSNDKNSDINFYIESMICEVEDINIVDSNTDIIVGSLTIIFGIILFLSTSLLYIPKKKLHLQLQDDHDTHLHIPPQFEINH